MVKLNKLSDLAEKLGIHLSFMPGYRTIVQDRERNANLPSLYLEEIDNGQPVDEFPPTFEYRIIFDNPEYLAAQQREQEEYTKKRAQEELVKTAAEKAEKDRRARELEQRERAELARLRNKYKE
jgi:hypothetical protein